MALSSEQARRLVDAQGNAITRVRESTLARVERVVGGFFGWWSDAEVEAMSRQIVLVVQAGQTQTARLTDAYLALVIGQSIGRPIPPVGVPIAPEEWRRAPAVEVYARPAADVRRTVVAGSDVLDSAMSAAMKRYQVMAETDLMLAKTNTAQAVFERRSGWVSGYRRVLKLPSCGLCTAAADRIYHRSDLMPIHARCNCDVMPIVGDDDPGRSLNDNELNSLYEAAGSTRGADLKRVRVAVHENGEIGPVLTDARHAFRGPGKVPNPRSVIDPGALDRSKVLEKAATAAHQAGDFAERDRLRAEALDLRRTAYGTDSAAA